VAGIVDTVLRSISKKVIMFPKHRTFWLMLLVIVLVGCTSSFAQTPFNDPGLKSPRAFTFKATPTTLPMITPLPRHGSSDLLRTARTQWENANVTHYQLSILYPDRFGIHNQIFHICQQIIEVQDDEIVAVLRDDCPVEPLPDFCQPPIIHPDGLPVIDTEPNSTVPCSWIDPTPYRTVSELFTTLSQVIRRYEGRCGPNGCTCDGRVVILPQFDATYGYPKGFAWTFRRTQSQGSSDSSGELVCPLLGMSIPNDFSATLIPLP
jgi:hypothetical protein